MPADGDPHASRADSAARALEAYRTMQSRFGRADGSLRRDGWQRLLGGAAHVWPFARAFVATLDLAGVPRSLVPDFDGREETALRRRALERYWDASCDPPAYSSDVIGSRTGGDRYHDDNAWIGLGLVQLERLCPGSAALPRAAAVFRFAVAGWDRRTDVVHPGGVFWVEQGRGAGRRNHDRNTVSTAPNAQVGLHLAQLQAPDAGPDPVACATAMRDWVETALRAPDAPLYRDKIRGDGSVDVALWSYNQGSVLGLDVLLHRRAAAASTQHLTRAQATARAALAHYADRYLEQPAAFNAIFFRNLLQLHAAGADTALQTQILTAMRAYADRAWSTARDEDDCFHLDGSDPSLLDQSAMVQLLALLAWTPADYAKLA